MLTQTSTPVPLRLAKHLIAGTIITASAYVAAAGIHTGLAFGYERGVTVSLARIESLAGTSRAIAQEQPQLLAATKPITAKKKPYYVKPAAGLDWGILHANNGVDIANECGTAVVAAASGKVVEVSTGWNGGYGNAVLIKHGNKTKTFYAHLEDVLVNVGDLVDQNQEIGTIGMTGKSTGCHLHFEVHGAANPFGN